MIFDAFLFFNELDILELRLKTMADVVDKFVIIESPLSFRGVEKPLHYFDERDGRFAPWKEKILHVVVNDMPPNATSAWDRESWQREATKRALDPIVSNHDLVVIGDVDEIIRPESIKLHVERGARDVATLALRAYYYYFNIQSRFTWLYPKICTGKVLKSTPAGGVRHWPLTHDDAVIFDAGWHFTYMGGFDQVHSKVSNFSHWNEAPYAHMVDGVKNPLAHHSKLSKVEIDGSYPKDIFENQERWKSLGYIF